MNKIKIDKLFKNIDLFYKNNCRSKNDKCNKIREEIISLIINDKIYKSFYINNNEYSMKWINLKNKIHNFINIIYNISNINLYKYNLSNNDLSNNQEINYKCILKAGRKFNYDFDLIIYNIKFKTELKYNIELKYNTTNIIDCPQFVSPMYPSNYLSNSYEDYHYKNCIPLISKIYNLPIPEYNDYIKEIHKPKPKNIMSEYQIQYKKGYKKCNNCSIIECEKCKYYKEIYNKTKKITKDGIVNFISSEETKLNIPKLSEYLIKSQKNKLYMLINKGNIIYQKINIDNYDLDETYCIKEPNKSRFIVKSKSGIKLNILLRWKNGNGIAFPAFQINEIKTKKITKKITKKTIKLDKK